MSKWERSYKPLAMASKFDMRQLPSIAYHCGVGLLVRVLLCAYSLAHDKYFKLAYTDADYRTLTYAARDVIAQRSPYEQPGFRHSPFVAYLFTANVLLHPICGKLIASFFDVYLAYRIYRVVTLTHGNERKALQCAWLWLYNPLPALICSRGNVDSLAAVFVLLAVLYHLRRQYVWSGALLAVGAHLRLYPLVFVPAFAVACDRYSSADTLRRTYRAKLKFMAAFAVAAAALTGAFYYVYGYKFVDAGLLYHVTRQDVLRHNYSLYAYMQYLDAVVPGYVSKNLAVLDPKMTKNLLIVVPNVALQLAITYKYSTLKHLPFNLYCTAFVFVVFNKVLASQYFVWFFSLLPLFLPSIVLSTKKVAAIVGTWCGVQALWLFASYLLEFEGYDTFAYIHGCSIAFYLVNVWILVTFVHTYNVQYVKKVD